MKAEARNEPDDLASPKTEDQIIDKFRRLTRTSLGPARVDRIVTEPLRLDSCDDVATIARLFDPGVR